MYRALLIFAAYLVGTFPTARLVVPGITRRGSGNPGASNAFRLEGRSRGAVVLLGDAAKGALATVAGLAAPGGGRPLAIACGMAAVAGHCFPLTAKGGKGVATAAGVAAVLLPLQALAAAAVWSGVARTTGKASLASLAATLVVPAGAALAGRPSSEVAALAVVAAVIAMRHASNVRQLVRGEERSLR